MGFFMNVLNKIRQFFIVFKVVIALQSAIVKHEDVLKHETWCIKSQQLGNDCQ